MSEAKPDAKRSEGARRAALFVPLILVNAFAVYGQAAWAYDHITPTNWEAIPRWVLAVAFACAVESIGVYLALEAHDALMSDQASGLLRLGSYLVGVTAGALNYWHFAGPRFGLTAAALTFALLSAISPWLWAIRSRALNRDRLRELGLLDERGVKLSTSRKFWHPVKSLRVVRWAAWAGVKEPAAAVAGWTSSTSSTPARHPKPRPAAPTPQVVSPAPLAGRTVETQANALNSELFDGAAQQPRPAQTSNRRGPRRRVAAAKADVRKRYADGEALAQILLRWEGDKPSKRTLEIWTEDLRAQHAAAKAQRVNEGDSHATAK